MLPSQPTSSNSAASSATSAQARGDAGNADNADTNLTTDAGATGTVGQHDNSLAKPTTDEITLSAIPTTVRATGDLGGVAVECPDCPDMPKGEGMEGGLGSLRHRHSPLDTGSMADSSMKQGQMSPSFPTTPDKNMSHIGTPDPSVSNSYNKHSKRESYKAQKRTYRSQKKEAAKELLSTITDPAVVLLGDWLKVRGTLKSWSKLWCVLKPGVLVLYKSDKHKGSQWVGTILLNTCQLLERPSKKDGFCFKLFHPLDQSIWATKGPKGETIGAFVQPLPYSYCIFRAPSESAGKCWMDALELALKCTNLLKRSMTRLDNTIDAPTDLELDRSRAQESSWQPPSHYEEYHGSQNGSDHLHDGETDLLGHSFNSMRAQERNMNDSDLERHFANQGAIASHVMKKKDALKEISKRASEEAPKAFKQTRRHTIDVSQSPKAELAPKRRPPSPRIRELVRSLSKKIMDASESPCPRRRQLSAPQTPKVCRLPSREAVKEKPQITDIKREGTMQPFKSRHLSVKTESRVKAPETGPVAAETADVASQPGNAISSKGQADDAPSSSRPVPFKRFKYKAGQVADSLASGDLHQGKQENQTVQGPRSAWARENGRNVKGTTQTSFHHGDIEMGSSTFGSSCPSTTSALLLVVARDQHVSLSDMERASSRDAPRSVHPTSEACSDGLSHREPGWSTPGNSCYDGDVSVAYSTTCSTEYGQLESNHKRGIKARAAAKGMMGTEGDQKSRGDVEDQIGSGLPSSRKVGKFDSSPKFKAKSESVQTRGPATAGTGGTNCKACSGYDQATQTSRHSCSTTTLANAEPKARTGYGEATHTSKRSYTAIDQEGTQYKVWINHDETTRASNWGHIAFLPVDTKSKFVEDHHTEGQSACHLTMRQRDEEAQSGSGTIVPRERRLMFRPDCHKGTQVSIMTIGQTGSEMLLSDPPGKQTTTETESSSAEAEGSRTTTATGQRTEARSRSSVNTFSSSWQADAESRSANLQERSASSTATSPFRTTRSGFRSSFNTSSFQSQDESDLSNMSLQGSSVNLNESATSGDLNVSAKESLSFSSRSQSKASIYTTRESSSASRSRHRRHHQASGSSKRGKKKDKGGGGHGKEEGGKEKKKKKKDKGEEKSVDGGEGGGKKKKKKKDKGDKAGEEEKSVAGEGEGGKKKKKKKDKDKDKEGEKSDNAAEGGEGGGKKKKKKKDKHKEGEKSGDHVEGAGEEGDKKKKKKKHKDHDKEGDHGDDAGEEGDKKKKKKKKDKDKEEDAGEGGDKKKKRKKSKGDDASGEESSAPVEATIDDTHMEDTPTGSTGESLTTGSEGTKHDTTTEGGSEFDISSAGVSAAPSAATSEALVAEKHSAHKTDHTPKGYTTTSSEGSLTSETTQQLTSEVSLGGTLTPMRVTTGGDTTGTSASGSAPTDSASEARSSSSPGRGEGYISRNTSTTENEQLVFEMPYGSGKGNSLQPGSQSKIDHFLGQPQLSQLCPKCLSALRGQNNTAALAQDSARKPLFVTQKYKVVPVDNTNYLYDSPEATRKGPGIALDGGGPPAPQSCAAGSCPWQPSMSVPSGYGAASENYPATGLDDDKSDREDSESTQSEFEEDAQPSSTVITPPEETNYVINSREELGQSGDDCQTEEVTDENKSLIWTLVKQVRPGMDLSKVVLPTFILEPRSFLDKLSDYYYHADILSGAVLEESPYSRMKSVVRWYLSGFYKKPKGLKKPYNPVIGEAFRCCWHHPVTGSRTFYIAEQVSHHPPISVFHVTNRKDGFNISGSILARSKFYGNSLSAILDGVARLSFLERGEDYYITMPYAHCKGILIGTLTMELGGKVTIDCPKTGYKCELEFKLKPFLGSGQASNRIHGKITMGSDVLAMIDGHWDQEIYIKDRALDKKRDVFWNPTPEIRAGRLKRFTVPIADQYPFESERLWEGVSKAVMSSDMQAATNEKYIIEEEQRKQTRERKLNKTEWVPRYFEKDYGGADWIYKHADDRPWDPVNDVYQYEHAFVVQTQTRHKTPHLRATSLSSLNKSVEKKKLRIPRTVEESDSSGHGLHRESDSSDYVATRGSGAKTVKLTQEGLALLFDPLLKMQEETTQALRSLQQQVMRLEMQHISSAGAGGGQGLLSKDWVTLSIILIFQIILQWIFR